MSLQEQNRPVSALVLRSWPVQAGGWRAAFQVEASRVRGEVATADPVAEGQRLTVRPSGHAWSLAGVAER